MTTIGGCVLTSDTFRGAIGGITARDLRRIVCAVAVAGLVPFLSACATLSRLPAVPLAMAHGSAPLGVTQSRFYADGDVEAVEAIARDVLEKRRQFEGASFGKGKFATNHFLAISGGGDDGAFGAGLLLGWTERGDRPSFRIVTGISTGALSAPFAFLGPEYDAKLKAVYTDTSAEDIFMKRILLAAVTDDAMTDTTPLRNLIAGYIDQKMVARIAEEYDKGRLLLIATTNLDQARSVIWNIGAIAKSNDPRARELIIDVLRASASIPGVFPPVMLNVKIEGKNYEEMHVDGGTVAQAFLYPPAFSIKKTAVLAPRAGSRKAYVIRNGRLFRPEQSVKKQTLAIVGQTISTMTAASGVNDTYRIYLTTKRDNVDFNLAYIDDEFATPYTGPFDKTYMRKLFQYGYEKGKAGYAWHKTPPGYQE
ncbi:MAG: patatin-like phospholipase family protein [Alphaproteobacteria bacterium]|nr:patatin-like phospholipase family protein [Alphaproteobacteria bacterium]